MRRSARMAAGALATVASIEACVSRPFGRAFGTLKSQPSDAAPVGLGLAPVLDPLPQAHAATTNTKSSAAARKTDVLRADGDAARHRRQSDEERIGVLEGRL